MMPSSKKMEEDLQKKMEDDLKKIEMEDDLQKRKKEDDLQKREKWKTTTSTMKKINLNWLWHNSKLT